MHTPEPWAGNEQRLESSREHGVANDGWCIAEFYGPDAKDYVSRTRACVNAMAGIADPAAFVEKVRLADEARRHGLFAQSVGLIREAAALVAAAEDRDWLAKRVAVIEAEALERAAIVANDHYKAASERWNGTPDNYDQGQVDMAEDIERDIRSLITPVTP